MATATITAKLGLDGRGFRAGLQSAENSTRRFTRNIGGYIAGAFTIGAISSQIKTMISEASKINDMSKSLGLTTEEFQALDFAAKQTGSTIEGFAKAITTIARSQKDALTKGPESDAALTYKRLGVAFEDLKKSGPLDLFLRLDRSYKSGAIGIQNMADLLKVLGRGNLEVIGAMEEGISGLIDSFREMGLAIGDDVIGKLDELGDQMDIIMRKWSLARAELGVAGAESGAGLMEALKAGYAFTSTLVSELASATWKDKGAGMKAWDKAMQSLEAMGELAVEDEMALRDWLRDRKAAQERRLANRLAAETANEEMAKQQKVITQKLNFAPASDALARIGGFVGGAGRNRGIEIAEKQLKKLDSIEDYVRRVVFGVL